MWAGSPCTWSRPATCGGGGTGHCAGGHVGSRKGGEEGGDGVASLSTSTGGPDGSGGMRVRLSVSIRNKGERRRATWRKFDPRPPAVSCAKCQSGEVVKYQAVAKLIACRCN
jgi:hypothetical protein